MQPQGHETRSTGRADGRDAIDIYNHTDLKNQKEFTPGHIAIEDLIDIAPIIKLQNKNHLAYLVYFINKPVFAKSHPESCLMAFALFDIKIGR
jgi:hypothetical protein